MKSSRFSEERIIRFLKEHEAGVSRSPSVSQARRQRRQHLGRCFRIMTVVGDRTRENLALVTDTDTSPSGYRGARELDQPTTERGKPRIVVSDKDTELNSNAIRT
jgi:hypothetical protein